MADYSGTHFGWVNYVLAGPSGMFPKLPAAVGKPGLIFPAPVLAPGLGRWLHLDLEKCYYASQSFSGIANTTYSQDFWFERQAYSLWFTAFGDVTIQLLRNNRDIIATLNLDKFYSRINPYGFRIKSAVGDVKYQMIVYY